MPMDNRIVNKYDMRNARDWREANNVFLRREQHDCEMYELIGGIAEIMMDSAATDKGLLDPIVSMN